MKHPDNETLYCNEMFQTIFDETERRPMCAALDAYAPQMWRQRRPPGRSLGTAEPHTCKSNAEYFRPQCFNLIC